MAGKELQGVPDSKTMAAESVLNQEVEQFRMERVAVKLFLFALNSLVNELESKVSPRNPVLMSIRRFLRNYR